MTATNQPETKSALEMLESYLNANRLDVVELTGAVHLLIAAVKKQDEQIETLQRANQVREEMEGEI